MVAAEAAVVLTMLPASQQQVLRADGASYLQYALNLVHHGVFSEAASPPYYPSVARAPGYPAFLAIFYWLGAHPTIAVQAAQFGVLAATAIVVGWIGRVVAGPRVGFVAALISATYLPWIEFTRIYMTEDLGTLGLASFILLLLLARRSDRISLYAVSGLALALLTYVRPEYLVLVVPVACILCMSRPADSRIPRRRWRAGLALGSAFVVAILPWTIRNASVTGGKVVPMAGDSGGSLLESADQYKGFLSYAMNANDWRRFGAQQIALQGPAGQGDARSGLRQDARLRAAAIRIFKSLSVGRIVSSIPKRLLYLWWWADLSPPGRWTNMAHRAAELQYVLLLLLGVAGVLIRRKRLLSDWPLWIVAVYLTVLHLGAGVESRYTLPARSTLLVYSTVGACAAAAWLSARLRSAGQPGAPFTKARIDAKHLVPPG